MHRLWTAIMLGGAISIATASMANAEILAMMNYETKSAEGLKAIGIETPRQREEGIAIIDVDPKSDSFGKIVKKYPLPADLVAHHIFYDRTQTKAYISALGKPLLHVMDLRKDPYLFKTVEVPACSVGEDIVFSEDNSTWYLSCMGSATIVVGDAATDKVRTTIATPGLKPHGLAVHGGIDRLLTTNTVRPADLGEAGEQIGVIEISTGKMISTIKMSDKLSPSGEAPVEVVFAPKSKPPVAYVTNMFGGSLWTLTWNPDTKDFKPARVYDFSEVKAGVPLEIYFNDAGDRLYVTTAKPGKLHIFDIAGGPRAIKLLKTIDTGEGAHHVAFTKDWRYAFVQNALLNLPGMSDGSITVVDLEKGEAVASVDTLKKQGFNPNSIVLLPEWNHPAGH